MSCSRQIECLLTLQSEDIPERLLLERAEAVQLVAWTPQQRR